MLQQRKKTWKEDSTFQGTAYSMDNKKSIKSNMHIHGKPVSALILIWSHWDTEAIEKTATLCSLY